MDTAWITTFTGKKFYPAVPDPELISIIDIAHALSMICRYAGHCTKFYSVAEHSVRLCDSVPDDLKPLALMHDSAEAYLLDVPSLLKDTIFKGYRQVEDTLLKCILDKFGLVGWQPEDWSKIKKAENALLAAEVRDLLSTGGAGWYLLEEPLPQYITPVAWYKAESMFLKTFIKYVGRERYSAGIEQ